MLGDRALLADTDPIGGDLRKELEEAFRGMMAALYKEEGATLRIGLLAEPEAQAFIGAHAGALDSSFKTVEMSDTMRRRLQRSDYVFSGMKAFHELNEAFPSLLDENGDRKTFERFLNDVRSVDATYNRNYLRSEFNFVQASAEMAAKWEQFMQDGDRYYLQYRTAHDDKVRPTHAALHGVTLPVTDTFWDEFYPPNGWNCRCTVVQVRKSRYPATPHDEAMALGEEALEFDKKGMFRFNPGKQEKAVPDYNPYTISRCKDCDIAKGKLKLAKAFIPDNELCQACQLLRSCLEHRESKAFREYRKDVINSAKAIDNKKCPNLQTKSYYQTKKSLKRGIAHAYNIEEVEMFESVEEYVAKLTFIRYSPLGEVKDMTNPKDIANVKKKIHRGVTGYNVYEVSIRGEIWEVKTEVFKDKTETLYVAIKKG